MRNGVCPKCRAQAVHVGKETGYRGTFTYHRLSTAVISVYICTNCGYLEEYIEQDNQRAGIADHWPQVPVTAAPPEYTPEAPTRRLPDLPRE